jgi:hypothetical protein
VGVGVDFCIVCLVATFSALGVSVCFDISQFKYLLIAILYAIFGYG